MCFDVPKVVRSPGFDHGHNEEFRNGRDIKIDRLKAYVWTSERFRVIQVFFGVPESYGNTYWALLGHTGIEERGQKEGGARPHLVRIGQGLQPTFPCWRRKEEEREKEKGAAPLVQFGSEGGAGLLPFGLSPLF